MIWTNWNRESPDVLVTSTLLRHGNYDYYNGSTTPTDVHWTAVDSLNPMNSGDVDWQDVSFRDLRSEGGFIISAERKAGSTVSLSVRAVVDSKLILKDPFEGRSVKWNIRNVKKVGGFYECNLKEGQELKNLD